MEKLAALFNLFRKGDAVSNPADWKNGAIGIMALVPLLLAIDRVATAFGYPLGLDGKTAADIATGIVAVVGVLSHLATSDKIGLPARREADSPD